MSKTKKIKKIRKNKTRKIKPVSITSNFESGNIIHKSSRINKKLKHIINLEIMEEPYPTFTKENIRIGFILKQVTYLVKPNLLLIKLEIILMIGRDIPFVIHLIIKTGKE